MEKTLDKRLEDLERQYADLSESNSKLWLHVTQLAQTVEKMAKSQDEFVKKVNESEENTIKALNEIRDNLLFLSAKGSKPS
jgi:uncharacterized coiled-coil protein SlyX